MEEQKPRRKTHTSSAVKDRYNAKAYDDIKLRVKKGEKAFIQSKAEEAEKSLNAYINDCIRGKKPGMNLFGTKSEVTKMLKLFNPKEKISYVYNIASGSVIIAESTADELIKLISSDEEKEVHLEILV